MRVCLPEPDTDASPGSLGWIRAWHEERKGKKVVAQVDVSALAARPKLQMDGAGPLGYSDARRRHKRALIAWEANQTGDAFEQALRAREAEARAHRDKVLQRVTAEDNANATVLSAFACKPRPPPAAPLSSQMKKFQAGARGAALHKQQPSKGGAKCFMLGAGAGGDAATPAATKFAATPAAGNVATPAAAAAAAGGAGAGTGVGSVSRLFAKRASAKEMKAKEEEGAAPVAAADFKRGAIGRKSCAQMRRDAKAEAASFKKEGGVRGPAGDDAIDNEMLVTALAKDMLGEGLHEGEASQMAELYAKNARALLEA